MSQEKQKNLISKICNSMISNDRCNTTTSNSALFHHFGNNPRPTSCGHRYKVGTPGRTSGPNFSAGENNPVCLYYTCLFCSLHVYGRPLFSLRARCQRSDLFSLRHPLGGNNARGLSQATRRSMPITIWCV
jgi:hypothetical protein